MNPITAPAPSMIDAALRALAEVDRPGLCFEDRTWTWRECLAEMSARAAVIGSMRVDGPLHVGLMLDNTPEFHFWLGASILAGATMVGVNPTRRGAELAGDIRTTECQLIVADNEYVDLLADLDLGVATGRVLVPGTAAHDDAVAANIGAALPAPTATDAHILFLLFTSGTSGGAAKAVIRTHGRLTFVCQSMVSSQQLTADDVTYICMPLFHSNALFTGWLPSIVAGATIALRRRFSASEFLPDVRRFAATYFNYVGKPLAYILATPPQPDDADNTLRRGFGNEGNEHDLARFAERFGCLLTDGYGQSETGASIGRVPGMPNGALGMAAPEIKVLDPGGDECPAAEFDVDGRLLNADVAIGEIVNTGFTLFEGYYNNPEATAERMRDGYYWTGDLAYRDANGFFYFAGRTADWIRVDGENFSAAPIERIVDRFPGVILCAAYGVPDPAVGDQVMVALQHAGGFDIEVFAEFLHHQNDLGVKWMPSFVRLVESFPMTQTNKVLKRQLVLEALDTADPVWRRTRGTTLFEPLHR